MKEQKVIITNDHVLINDFLNRGWEIESVTPQNVSAAVTYSASEIELRGQFCFVLKKYSR